MDVTTPALRSRGDVGRLLRIPPDGFSIQNGFPGLCGRDADLAMQPLWARRSTRRRRPGREDLVEVGACLGVAQDVRAYFGSVRAVSTARTSRARS